MFTFKGSSGLSAARRRTITGAEEKMGLPWDAYYVLTKAEARLANSKVHPNSGAPDYDVQHNVSDLTGDTDDLTEGSTNLYYTDARVLSVAEPIISAGTTAQYWRGDKSWQTLNTTAVAEGTNLYYTDARVDTYGDTQWLKLDGSNANANINIGAYNLTTTGIGKFGLPAFWTAEFGGFNGAVYTLDFRAYEAYLSAGDAAGYFTDGTTATALSDGAYAINSSGPSYFVDGGDVWTMEFFSSSAIDARTNYFGTGAQLAHGDFGGYFYSWGNYAMLGSLLAGAGYFSDYANEVYLADGSYAINATGNSLFTGKLTATGTGKFGSVIVGNTTTPTAGEIRFDGTHFYGYNGSTWLQLDN